MVPPYLLPREFPTALTLQEGNVSTHMAMAVFCEGAMREGSQHPLLLVCMEIHTAT